MNKAIVATISKQHRQYQTEANAKRRNLIDLAAGTEPNAIVSALTLNEHTLLIARTEAKAVAIEELAAELGIELEVG